MSIPHDPDSLNDKRAKDAWSALLRYREKTSTSDDAALCFLLCDLMHWCDRTSVKFETELIAAREHYAEETEQNKSCN